MAPKPAVKLLKEVKGCIFLEDNGLPVVVRDIGCEESP